MAKKSAATSHGTSQLAAAPAPEPQNLIQRAIAIGRAYAQAHVPPSPAGGEKDFWQKQGPHIREALTAAYNALKAGLEAEVGALGITWKHINRTQVTAIFTEAVKQWDDEFKWDAPNMNEKAEDTFYGFVATKHLNGLFSADGF